MQTKNELIELPSYKEQVQLLKEHQKNTTPGEILSVFIVEQQEMSKSEIGKNALQPGSIAPQFVLPNASGKSTALKDALANGNVVLSFYRGAWCPFCNLQLKIYQDMLPQIKSLGASLIAVSPMTPDNSLSLKEKHSLEFEVLSDIGNAVASQYGIVYKVDEKVIDVTLKLGMDTPSMFNGTNLWELPLPATFIINEKGIIIHTFIEKDYTKRIEPQDLLTILKKIEHNALSTK